MKKVTLAVLAAGILISDASAYQLVTSAYYPNNVNTYRGDMPWLNAIANEMTEQNFAKNYLNKTFIAGMADVFDRDGLASDDKKVRDAFSKRTLSATLGFHKRAVVKGDGIDYSKRVSNMIDFISIPALKTLANNETLDDYSTRIRKEALNAAKGKAWAGGTVTSSLSMRDYRFGYTANGVANQDWVQFPAMINGVQYNSFASELLTVLQASRTQNVEMEALAAIEQVANMSDAQIEEAVKSFNVAHAQKDGIDHPLRECYGYTNEQIPAYMQAGILLEQDLMKADEFVSEMAKQQSAAISRESRRTGGYSASQDFNTDNANNMIANPLTATYSTNKQCMIQSLKSFAPNKWAEYDKKKADGSNKVKSMLGGRENESLFGAIWKAPFRAMGAYIRASCENGTLREGCH